MTLSPGGQALSVFLFDVQPPAEISAAALSEASPFLEDELGVAGCPVRGESQPAFGRSVSLGQVRDWGLAGVPG